MNYIFMVFIAVLSLFWTVFIMSSCIYIFILLFQWKKLVHFYYCKNKCISLLETTTATSLLMEKFREQKIKSCMVSDYYS